MHRGVFAAIVNLAFVVVHTGNHQMSFSKMRVIRLPFGKVMYPPYWGSPFRPVWKYTLHPIRKMAASESTLSDAVFEYRPLPAVRKMYDIPSSVQVGKPMAASEATDTDLLIPINLIF